MRLRRCPQVADVCFDVGWLELAASNAVRKFSFIEGCTDGCGRSSEESCKYLDSTGCEKVKTACYDAASIVMGFPLTDAMQVCESDARFLHGMSAGKNLVPLNAGQNLCNCKSTRFQEEIRRVLVQAGEDGASEVTLKRATADAVAAVRMLSIERTLSRFSEFLRDQIFILTNIHEYMHKRTHLHHMCISTRTNACISCQQRMHT